MRRSSKGGLLYLFALLCLIVAGALALKSIGFAATTGDAAFEPPSVCDAACQTAWQKYGKQGDKWMVGAFLVFLGGVGAVVVGRRLRQIEG